MIVGVYEGNVFSGGLFEAEITSGGSAGVFLVVDVYFRVIFKGGF